MYREQSSCYQEFKSQTWLWALQDPPWILRAPAGAGMLLWGWYPHPRQEAPARQDMIFHTVLFKQKLNQFGMTSWKSEVAAIHASEALMDA